MIYKDLTGLTGEPVSPAPSGEAELIIRARGRGAEALTDEIWEHRCAQLGARPGGGSGCTEDSARHRPQSPRDGVAGETRDDLVPPTGLVWLLAPQPGLCSGVSAPLPGFGGSCTQPGGAWLTGWLLGAGGRAGVHTPWVGGTSWGPTARVSDHPIAGIPKTSVGPPAAGA